MRNHLEVLHTYISSFGLIFFRSFPLFFYLENSAFKILKIRLTSKPGILRVLEVRVKPAIRRMNPQEEGINLQEEKVNPQEEN